VLLVSLPVAAPAVFWLPEADCELRDAVWEAWDEGCVDEAGDKWVEVLDAGERALSNFVSAADELRNNVDT